MAITMQGFIILAIIGISHVVYLYKTERNKEFELNFRYGETHFSILLEVKF